jgi:hypothetical protein
MNVCDVCYSIKYIVSCNFKVMQRTAVGIMFPDKRRNTFLMLRRGLISLWLLLFPVFLFAAQPKEFFLDGLKKLEQRSHKFVELRGICRVNTFFFNPVACCFLYKPKDLSAPLVKLLCGCQTWSHTLRGLLRMFEKVRRILGSKRKE